MDIENNQKTKPPKKRWFFYLHFIHIIKTYNISIYTHI